MVENARESVHFVSRSMSSRTYNCVSQNTDWRIKYCYRQSFVAPPSDKSGSYFGTDRRPRRRFYPLAYLCDDASRTSPRAGRRARPVREPSTQEGTVAEEANEMVHLASTKRPRRAKSARVSRLVITRIYGHAQDTYMCSQEYMM